MQTYLVSLQVSSREINKPGSSMGFSKTGEYAVEAENDGEARAKAMFKMANDLRGES